ncbi:MAG TPA: outer membrane lipoprotein chaperone LolA [Steroidobacteraceae bacterium]|nr:outer membrane lipoprotein chaperone LolA [Steroidobacteraceae bacterium]
MSRRIEPRAGAPGSHPSRWAAALGAAAWLALGGVMTVPATGIAASASPNAAPATGIAASAAPNAATANAAPAAPRAAASAAPAPAAPNAAAAAEVEKYLGGLASWSADFEQNIEDADGQVLRSAAGRLYLQRPGRFRWDYTKPSEQLILADGKRIWFYDKDLAQANVRDMDTSLASTPASLLSGQGSVSTQFDVTSLPPGNGLKWFQLVPKHTDTDFRLVRIGIDKNGDLKSMFLADKLNQITQLSFSNSKRNDKFPPDLFTFVPPPGVDVIGQSAK